MNHITARRVSLLSIVIAVAFAAGIALRVRGGAGADPAPGRAARRRPRPRLRRAQHARQHRQLPADHHRRPDRGRRSARRGSWSAPRSSCCSSPPARSCAGGQPTESPAGAGGLVDAMDPVALTRPLADRAVALHWIDDAGDAPLDTLVSPVDAGPARASHETTSRVPSTRRDAEQWRGSRSSSPAARSRCGPTPRPVATCRCSTAPRSWRWRLTWPRSPMSRRSTGALVPASHLRFEQMLSIARLVDEQLRTAGDRRRR